MRHGLGGFYAKAIYHLASALCACWHHLCRIFLGEPDHWFSHMRCDEEGR
jgi:hypothetical protein